ncbi:MAG: hypothetical protein ACRD3S_19005, partial [Terracidiphilus sp.]
AFSRRKRMGLNAAFDEPGIRVHGSTGMGCWSNGILINNVTKGLAQSSRHPNPTGWTRPSPEELDPAAE